MTSYHNKVWMDTQDPYFERDVQPIVGPYGSITRLERWTIQVYSQISLHEIY